MDRTHIILDCNFLCRRALYALGQDVSKKEVKHLVIKGFFSDIENLEELYGKHTNFIFCWDGRNNIRNSVCPEYKGNRKVLDDDKKEIERRFLKCIKRIRTKYLPMARFKNVFHSDVFESDDLIGSICKSLPETQKAVIVSADRDLFQLITENIQVYNPIKKQTRTLQSFKKEFGILPQNWVKVKAIAGCDTDNVKGIKGVGEKSVLKYLLGKLKPSSAAYKKIREQEDLIMLKNVPLVKLPFKGTPKFEIVKDNKKKIWKHLVKLKRKLEMR